MTRSVPGRRLRGFVGRFSSCTFTSDLISQGVFTVCAYAGTLVWSSCPSTGLSGTCVVLPACTWYTLQLVVESRHMVTNALQSTVGHSTAADMVWSAAA